VDEDGSLKVYPPNLRTESVPREMKVKISITTSPELMTRIIYSLYILGFDKITIETLNGPFSEDLLRKIKESVRSLIGLEIVSQDITSIQIQSFLDPTKYNIGSLVNRLTNTLKQMLHYLNLGIREASRTFLQEVVELEKEVDRLYYLSLRQLLLAQVNRSLAYMIGVKRIQIVGNRILMKAAEEAADEISEAANDLLSLHPEDLALLKMSWDKMDMLIDQTSVVIDHVVKVLNKEDIKLVNEALEELRTLRRVLLSDALLLEEKIQRMNAPKVATAIRTLNLRLYNAIRRMEPIAEIAFNRGIEGLKEVVIE
ncbi:MAG: histidine kinase, partial [Metallosphaera sp.]